MSDKVIIGRGRIKSSEEALYPATKDRFSSSMRKRVVCHYAALGMKVKDIAEKVGITAVRASAILNSEDGRATVRELQQELFATNHLVVFRSMAPQAARVLYRVMQDRDEKGSTRVTAASEILDRAYGKAAQPIEHSGALIKDLFDRMDKEKQSKEVLTVEVKAEKVQDPIDALVEDICKKKS